MWSLIFGSAGISKSLPFFHRGFGLQMEYSSLSRSKDGMSISSITLSNLNLSGGRLLSGDVYSSQVMSTWQDCVIMPSPHIYMGEPWPCIPPCVMASLAMGLKLGVFGICWPQKQNKMHPQPSRRTVFCACWSSSSDHSRCRWHTHLRNQGYFDYGKT